ncbi:MAG: hypothetical protein HYV75_06615 [Opitutae bacterium]|nr:hypothetical protein [Opitutae bacterium]
MKSPRPSLAGGLGLLALFALPPLNAQEAETSAAALPPEEKEMHKISGVFDTDLPKTERKGSIRFILHPHLGDFHRRSYVRLPFGIRWGVNDHLAFSAQVGSVLFGAKYAFVKWLKPTYDLSTGINVRLPVDHPPIDMTDGHNHYTPYLVIGRKSRRIADLTYFVNGTVDLMDQSSVPGNFRKNDMHSSSMILGTGFVLDRYPYHYTLEVGYQTTALIGRDSNQLVFVKPGFAWDLPRRFTFNSKGRWLVGLSMKFAQGPDGFRLDTSGKIRGEFSLRRWMNDRRNRSSTARP